MAKHQRPTNPTTGSSRMARTGKVFGRSVLIGTEQVRVVKGAQIEAGDVLPTGLVLEVTVNSIDGESRLEMLGANLHYVDHTEDYIVLATVARDVLDAISAEYFISRYHAQKVGA